MTVVICISFLVDAHVVYGSYSCHVRIPFDIMTFRFDRNVAHICVMRVRVIIRERAVSGKFSGRSFVRICVIRERKIFLIHTRMWVHYQRADRFEKFFCRPAVMTSETEPEPPPTPDHTPRPEPIPDRKRQTVRPSAHAARLDRMA